MINFTIELNVQCYLETLRERTTPLPTPYKPCHLPPPPPPPTEELNIQNLWNSSESHALDTWKIFPKNSIESLSKQKPFPGNRINEIKNPSQKVEIAKPHTSNNKTILNNKTSTPTNTPILILRHSLSSPQGPSIFSLLQL